MAKWEEIVYLPYKLGSLGVQPVSVASPVADSITAALWRALDVALQTGWNAIVALQGHVNSA